MNQVALPILVKDYLVIFLNRDFFSIILFASYWIGRIFPPIFYHKHSRKINSYEEKIFHENSFYFILLHMQHDRILESRSDTFKSVEK